MAAHWGWVPGAAGGWQPGWVYYSAGSGPGKGGGKSKARAPTLQDYCRNHAHTCGNANQPVGGGGSGSEIASRRNNKPPDPLIAFLDEHLAPDDPIVPWLPNYRLAPIPAQYELQYASFWMGYDAATAGISTLGWGFVGMSSFASPGDPSGMAFGLALANVGSALATLSLLNTLFTSGPNSKA